MTNTDILLEDLEDVLDDATSVPMTKKSLVDVEKIKTIIEDIRLNTPQETKQAKAIVDSRNSIIDEANKEKEEIIAQAQAQAKEQKKQRALEKKQSNKKAKVVVKTAQPTVKPSVKPSVVTEIVTEETLVEDPLAEETLVEVTEETSVTSEAEPQSDNNK